MDLIDKLVNYIKSPIGEEERLANVEQYINEAIQKWDIAAGEVETGFFGWIKRRKADLVQVTHYVLSCIDIFINAVEDQISLGENKKATVLYAVGKVYDHVIKGALPFWLVPFAPGLRYLILYTIVSTMVDFMVNKYNEGEWTQKKEEVEVMSKKTPKKRGRPRKSKEG